ncbi:MAG TPA: MBL fold metallo-hydrolase, partial [Segetibacter sp.]
MDNKQMYLKPNVVLEPLVDQWYAWSHLISPATAAMNIVSRHLTIIDSYLSAPSIHAEAVLNPKMRGGPFMDFGGGRLDEVKALQQETLQKQDKVLQLAKAIKELDKMLSTEAKGYGLETVYEKVPGILKGYVELYYDRNNNPGFRFFESLLYNSDFYNKGSQSIAMWITNNDERPFCLSTPRLEEDHILNLNIPFEHPGIDELAKMKRTPQSLGYIKAMLGIPASKEALFDTFFTETPPPAYQKYTG